MTFYYPAKLYKKPEGGYRVEYFDLDQCFGDGATEDEALADARANAIDWIQLELADTNDLPEVTHKDDVQLSPEERFVEMMIIMPREGWDE